MAPIRSFRVAHGFRVIRWLRRSLFHRSCCCANSMLSSTMFESGCGVQAVRPAPSNKAAMGSFNFMVTVDNFNFIYVYYLLALFNVFAISKLLRYRDYCHAYSFSSRTAIGVMYWLPWYCFPFRLHSKLPFGSFTFPRRRLLVPFCSG